MTGALISIQAFLAAASVALIPFQAMRSAVCDTQCDFDTAEAALTVAPIATVSVFVITLIVLAVRGERSRGNWLVVVAGIAITVAVMFVSNEIFKQPCPRCDDA